MLSDHPQSFKSVNTPGPKVIPNINQRVPPQEMVAQQNQINNHQNQQQNWDKILSNDKAGAANNAEDFTKQFMSQMYGNGTSNQTHNNHQSMNYSILYLRIIVTYL